jgi:hypothetical protein
MTRFHSKFSLENCRGDGHLTRVPLGPPSRRNSHLRRGPVAALFVLRVDSVAFAIGEAGCLYVYQIHAGDTCRGEQNGFTNWLCTTNTSTRWSNAGVIRMACERSTCVSGSTRLLVTSRSTCTAVRSPLISTTAGRV